MGAGDGSVDTNKVVVGFPHSGTYGSSLADGDSLVITLPYVARSVAVKTPVEMRWVNASGLSLALQPDLSVPTKAGEWFERVRQFTEIVLHNDTGGAISADTISWDAELTEIPTSDYPTRTEANGFEGHAAAFPSGTVDTETPA